MEILRTNTADNICFWVEDRSSGNMTPIYESHEAYEIYIVLKGERYMYMKNVLYCVDEGDAFMIPPNVPHRSFGESAFLGVCIEFSDAYLKSRISEQQYNRISECFRCPVISIGANAVSAIYNLSVLAENNSSVQLDSMLKIADILYSFIPQSTPDAKLCFESDLSTLGGYIQKNYLHISGLDELAEHFKITKSHLCRVFRQHTGITITHYINALRIQRACWLLTETDTPIHEIYGLCGYKNSQYFNRAFRKFKGGTPNAFRKHSRETKIWSFGN